MNLFPSSRRDKEVEGRQDQQTSRVLEGGVVPLQVEAGHRRAQRRKREGASKTLKHLPTIINTVVHIVHGASVFSIIKTLITFQH